MITMVYQWTEGPFLETHNAHKNAGHGVYRQ